MPEFKGTVSKSIQKYIINQTRYVTAPIYGISALLGSSLWFIFAKVIGVENWIALGIILTIFTTLSFLTIAIISPLSKKGKEDYCFNHIFFDGEYIVGKYPNGNEVFNLISDAKYIKDHGEFYEIYFARILIYCCQKDLLVSGTLEEFEALFEGKIVRVNEEEREK